MRSGRIDRRAVIAGALAAGAAAVAAGIGLGVTQTDAKPPSVRSARSAQPRPVRTAAADPASPPLMRAPLIDATRFGADPTGRRDSGPALRTALQTLGPGGGTIILPAGTFRVVATAAAPFLTLPERTVMRGRSATATVLNVESDDPAGYREFGRPAGADVVLQDLTIRRSGVFPAVLLNLPAVSGFTLSRVVLDGAYRAGNAQYCHGLQLAAQPGTASGLRIEDSTFTRCTSCTLITNESTGGLRDVAIVRCRMQNIDFNAPKADVSQIRIRDCVVDSGGSEYFGIAFAHVRDVVVSGTSISRARKEAVHIEDGCVDVTLTRCTITRSALGATDAYAYIQVINASTRITIDRCVVDARNAPSASRPSLIAVQQGGVGLTATGRRFAPPSDVTIIRNRLITDGSGAHDGVYLESVTRATVSDNRIDGGGVVAHGAFIGAADAAVDLVQPGDAVIAGNSITGWRTALAGQGDARGRIRFASNTVADCGRLLQAPGVSASGNAMQRVLTP